MICTCDIVGHAPGCPSYRPIPIWPGETQDINEPIYNTPSKLMTAWDPSESPPAPKHKKTYHEGANDERSAILAKVRRLWKFYCDPLNKCSPETVCTNLESWLLDRDKRCKKKQGGL